MLIQCQDVDRELKRVCEDLIAQCTSLATAPLRSFLDRCTSYLSSRPSNSTDLSAQEFAKSDKVLAVHADFKNVVIGVVEKWKANLMMYLQDEETVKVLVPPTHVCSISVTKCIELF